MNDLTTPAAGQPVTTDSEAVQPTLPSAEPTLNPTIGTLLALGITVEETTACLLENVSGIYRLAGWQRLPYQRGTSFVQQSAEVCRTLGDQLQRTLWDEVTGQPFWQSSDPVIYPPLEHLAVAVSPRPRLRVWLMGLTAGESLNAARQALQSAPTQLCGTTRLSTTLHSQALATELSDQQPEALVIVGGYDDPDPETHQWIAALCQQLCRAIERLSPGARPTIFYAGNHWAAADVETILRPAEGPLTVHLLRNILPYPGYPQRTELAVALSQLYWRRCQRLPGFASLSRWVTAPGHVANLESSFVKLVQLWMEYQELHQLHGLFTTPQWWLHVWADQAAQGVRLHFGQPGERPPLLRDWPPLQLVSGEWPTQLWSPPGVAWWDRSGLAPLLTTVGQVAPQAMLQVLEQDLIETRHRRSS